MKSLPEGWARGRFGWVWALLCPRLVAAEFMVLVADMDHAEMKQRELVAEVKTLKKRVEYLGAEGERANEVAFNLNNLLNRMRNEHEQELKKARDANFL